MGKELGIKLNPENERNLEKEGKKVPAYLVGLLAMVLIATYSFTLKNIEPASNILVTGGIVVYPLTFLLIALISKYYGFKEARKAIFISAALYASFFLLIMVGVIPKANTLTTGYNAVVQFLFANEFIDIGSTGYSFFYPTLGQFFSVVIAYVVSHLLYATIYNAVSKYTIDYLAMGLSLFVAYILDRLLFMPILFAKTLSNGANTFDYLIKCLTSEFIASIMITIGLIIVYIIFTAIKNAVKK